MMKFKYVHFFFDNELTPDQEGIFLANLNSLREEEMKTIERMYKELDSNIMWKAFGKLPMNNIAINLLKATLLRLMAKGNYIKVEKKGPTQYRFSYPYDDLALIHVNWGNNKLRAAKIMNDKVIISGLKVFVFPEMKINQKEVIIERGEYEEADEPAKDEPAKTA